MTDEGQQEAIIRRRKAAAERALEEAAERRRAQLQRESELTATRELNGRDGPEPVRFGDWEVKGIATDF